jgi:hypothetical protein
MTSHLNSSQPPTRQQFATTFSLAGRIGFWVQLALGAVSGISLFFALFSRSVGERTSSPVIGFGIFLAVVGILVLGFRVYWAFRYRRLAKRLQMPDSSLHPTKEDIVKVLRTGLIASLIGLLLAFLAAEVTVAAVLGKVLAQPQGVAIYNPRNIIPTLDIFVILANTNMIGAHLFGSVNSLWLLNWMDQ